MKQIIFLLLFGFSAHLIFAQDIIVKQNGDKIESKILEISSETIRYKEFKFQEGPIRNINISAVFMIIYENGKKEIFTTKDSETSKEGSTYDDKDKHFMLGTGYGNSYGGLGLRVQWRMGEKDEFGVHAGGGFFPNAPILVSAGVKYYPYKEFYINAQFGFTGFEKIYNNSYYGYVYDSYLLYGPSLLLGGDWTWGSKIEYGFNAGIGITYNINSVLIHPVTLALDLGFIIKF